MCLSDINLSIYAMLGSHNIDSLAFCQAATEHSRERNRSHIRCAWDLCPCYNVIEARANWLHLSDVSNCRSPLDVFASCYRISEIVPFLLRVLSVIISARHSGLEEFGTYNGELILLSYLW